MSTLERTEKPSLQQRGVSLIELVIFIAVIGVGLAGILSIINLTTRTSVDPMARKQALAIAESMLEEIELQPFTYCDPDDYPALVTATTVGVGAPNCSSAAQQQILAPMAIESRYGPNFFDNVADYNGFTMPAIRDITNTAVAGLAIYSLQPVEIEQAGATFGLPADAVLRITVRVTYANQADFIVLTGYRFRYAPNTGP
ncbi:hypothetical protein BH11PSE11_BH11PSE11_11390 [soil metagenome]